MNYASWIFSGVFFTFAFAWLGLVFFPNQQLKDLSAQPVEGTTLVHPAPYSGLALEGRQVYVANGCLYCHSQQIRGGHWNADLMRGWGSRRSAPQDYIFDNPQLLGTMRTGPDLLNVGARITDPQWHHKHLYNPQITSPGSNMPPFPFLYEKRRIVGQPSPHALKLEGVWAPPPGYEIVPTHQAQALVAYLLSLDRTYDLPTPATK